MAGIVLTLAAHPQPLFSQRSTFRELQTFSEAVNLLLRNHLVETGIDEIVAAALAGALESMDPHSYYVSAAEWTRMQSSENGETGTLGISILNVDDMITVLAVSPSSSADRNGVRPGDRIVRIDSSPVAGMAEFEVALLLTGEDGTDVTLGIERGSRLQPLPFELEMEFAPFVQEAVRGVTMVDDSTGYLQLLRFVHRSTDDVREAIDDLKGDGAERIIIDLRHNPGGELHVAVEVASLFLPESSLVMETRGRKRDINQEKRTETRPRFPRIPLVLITDISSASASEALAAGLQENGRARIVGTPTFGKGLMQLSFHLGNGGVLFMTVGEMFTPNGNRIQREFRNRSMADYLDDAGEGGGVTPDVFVEQPPEIPPWWSVALSSGIVFAVADSVAVAAGDDGRVWQDRSLWEDMFVMPLLDRVNRELDITAQVDAATRNHIAEIMVGLGMRVKLGRERAGKMVIELDPFIEAAIHSFVSPN